MEIVSFYSRIGVQDGVESVSSASDTVPDMSLSVKEILQRFRRGTLDPATLMRRYADSDDDIDDDFLDDPEDLVDIQERSMRVNSTVSDVLARHQQEHSVKNESQETVTPESE